MDHVPLQIVQYRPLVGIAIFNLFFNHYRIVDALGHKGVIRGSWRSFRAPSLLSASGLRYSVVERQKQRCRQHNTVSGQERHVACSIY